jgi:hypothetical protein
MYNRPVAGAAAYMVGHALLLVPRNLDRTNAVSLGIQVIYHPLHFPSGPIIT